MTPTLSAEQRAAQRIARKNAVLEAITRMVRSVEGVPDTETLPPDAFRTADAAANAFIEILDAYFEHAPRASITELTKYDLDASEIAFLMDHHAANEAMADAADAPGSALWHRERRLRLKALGALLGR